MVQSKLELSVSNCTEVQYWYCCKMLCFVLYFEFQILGMLSQKSMESCSNHIGALGNLVRMRNSSLGHSDPQISASVQSSFVRLRVCYIFRFDDNLFFLPFSSRWKKDERFIVYLPFNSFVFLLMQISLKHGHLCRLVFFCYI